MTKTNIREKTALLDKVVFGGISILGFDNKDNLITKDIVEMTSNANCRYITTSGQTFNRLLIENDGVIDRLIAGSKLMGGNRIDYNKK